MRCIFFTVFFQVYIPSITAHQISRIGADFQSRVCGDGQQENLKKLKERAMIRDELLHRTHKYLGVVNTSLQHLQIQGLFYFMYYGLG